MLHWYQECDLNTAKNNMHMDTGRQVRNRNKEAPNFIIFTIYSDDDNTILTAVDLKPYAVVCGL
jgi:hypothetical protein